MPKTCQDSYRQRLTILLVEHKDKLARFGTNYIKLLLGELGKTLEIVNEADNGRSGVDAGLNCNNHIFFCKALGVTSCQTKDRKNYGDRCKLMEKTMQLAERHIVKLGHNFFNEIDALCFASKNLYNAANYIIRQHFIYGWGYLNYNKMYKLMKYHEAYKALPAKVSQQILMVLDRNWKSFFEAVFAYELEPGKFTGRPKLPKYKDKEKGRNLLIYTIQAISKTALRKGLINLSGTKIEFPTLVDKEQICQVRIVPKCDCYVIEVIYEQPKSSSPPLNPDAVASIDLGLDNLATLTSNQKGFVPLLINGRTAKSINQFYNKRKAALQSKLKGNRKTSPRIQRLTRSRNQKIDNRLRLALAFQKARAKRSRCIMPADSL